MEEAAELFEPYRALGLYSTHIPHCTRYHKKHQEHYVFLAVGKVFHTYNCSKLGITQVSNAHPGDISCIAADRFFVYTGCKGVVRAFQHNRQVKYVYKCHDDEVDLLLPFAEHLISVDKSSFVKIWHIKSQELFLEMEFSNETFQISAILHPSTYLNKILFGSAQGTMQLWNIRKNQMLYEFKSTDDTSSIVRMVQSPAVDVIAIGRSSGNVIILNIKTDQAIMKFRQDEGPVIGIAFRTDGVATMVTGSPQGNVVVWDLEERRMLGRMEHVHASAISGITFLSGQPLMLTNSADNSIKMWAFDQSDGRGRLLRCRAGHSAPPTKIKFYENDDGSIISTGLDSSMRVFSTVHEENNRSFGQASLNRSIAGKAAVHFDEGKLPPIIDFCSKTAKEREWDNIVAFHRKSALATTWNFCHSRMGSHMLRHERFRQMQSRKKRNASKSAEQDMDCFVTSVAMTQCGNYCLIGYNSGHIDVYNIQSGIFRGSFDDDGIAHSKPITGVAISMLNQVVLSVGMDKLLKFWRFKTRKLLGVIELQAMPAMVNLQGENSLVAVALDNFSVQVYDLDTRKLVRYFPGCYGAITDMTWSTDGRWLVSSSIDCTIKTWELPSASLIDCFMVDAAAVSVALSPNSDLLASCHVDDLGIYLWSNRAIFGRISISPLSFDYHPLNVVELPATDVSDSSTEKEVLPEDVGIPVEDKTSDLGAQDMLVSQEPLDDDLVTLSSLPSSRWTILLSLDVIKKRNKPKDPPSLPKAAPFFLPTLAGLNPTFDFKEEEKTKIFESTNVNHLSELASSLLHQTSGGLPLPVMAKLKEMGPSALDVEIWSLSPVGGGSLELMSSFLSFILIMLRSKRDFELIESYLGLFLKVHAEMVARETTLMEILERIEKEHASAWGGLHKSIDQCICLLNHIKSVQF